MPPDDIGDWASLRALPESAARAGHSSRWLVENERCRGSGWRTAGADEPAPPAGQRRDIGLLLAAREVITAGAQAVRESGFPEPPEFGEAVRVRSRLLDELEGRVAP